jgi:hypothetical protein
VPGLPAEAVPEIPAPREIGKIGKKTRIDRGKPRQAVRQNMEDTRNIDLDEGQTGVVQEQEINRGHDIVDKQVGKILTWKEKDRLPDKQTKRQMLQESLTSRFNI